MSVIRTLVPRAAALGLVIILAACGQAAANPPSPSATPSHPASTPQPTEAPSVAPTPSAPGKPSAAPVVTPAPTSQPEVIEFDLPMLARATDEGINVRSMPSLDAPLISGEGHDLEKVPNIRLRDGELVFATMGPVVADGISWYQVAGAESEVHWERGWVAGQYLAREGGVPNYNPIVVDIHGAGSGAAASADVMVGTPITVDFAAVPMAGRDSCDIEVNVVRTDGTAVNVATESTIAARVAHFTPAEMSGLWQEEAGSVTLKVETDCSYAATLTIPQY